MTKDHDRKRLVRRRMSKTGESYAAASRQLGRPSRESSPMSQLLVGSDELQDALEHARRLAAGSGKSEVEPRHLVVGLLSVPECGAAEVMSDAGLTPRRVAAVLGVAQREQEGTPVRFSVAARSAVEFARAHAWEGTTLDRRWQRQKPPREGTPLAPRPVRTADLLLGLLDEGSVASALGSLVDLDDLARRLQELRDTDIECPPPWSSSPRYARLSRRVRALLARLDAGPIGTNVRLCPGTFVEVDQILRDLPHDRQAATAATIWEATKSRLRDELSRMPLKRLATLDEDALYRRFAQLVEKDPTVLRARRYVESTR